MKKSSQSAFVSLPILFGAVTPAWAEQPFHYMWGDGWGWGTGGLFMGAFGMLLFWGAIIALIIFAIRSFTPGSSRAPSNVDPVNADSSKSALSILSERYARGEIDQAEFNERRMTLLELDKDKDNLA